MKSNFVENNLYNLIRNLQTTRWGCSWTKLIEFSIEFLPNSISHKKKEREREREGKGKKVVIASIISRGVNIMPDLEPSNDFYGSLCL